MGTTVDNLAAAAAIRVKLGAIFASVELGKSIWLVTSLTPSSDKMSRRTVAGGDTSALLACLVGLRDKAQLRHVI
ncbi:transposase [Novosphingobium sp. Rr 2-17]|uniref:hypothetical protein n=1 Tax=Novosphingobium sp. Rr 2-17 TaxID=555793 RepID=UPI0002697BE8|nr:hypothetical protein [Novosphingobium sp. Rr 2-17]EIZ77146.1 transposase [Novosphingobium sp. Rr 2-17]